MAVAREAAGAVVPEPMELTVGQLVGAYRGQEKCIEEDHKKCLSTLAPLKAIAL